MNSRRRTVIYVTLLCIVALICVAVLFVASPVVPWPELQAILVLTAMALTADTLTYELADYASGTIASMPYLAAVLLVPNWLTALAVAATSAVASRRARSDRLTKAAFNIAQGTIGISLAIATYHALGGTGLGQARFSSFLGFTEAAMWPGLAAALTLLLTNSILFGLVVAVSQAKPIRHVWFRDLPRLGLGTVFQAPLVFPFVWLYVSQGPMAALALLAAMLLVRWGQVKHAQVQRVNGQLVDLIIRSMEAQSRYTSGHSQRVQRNSVFIAREILRLPDREVERIGIAALLHDIGKIGEKYTAILNKEGKLTLDERRVMQEHASDGANLLATMSIFREIVPLVRHHHEHWDGSGYPSGLSGEKIPLAARIIMFADTIDAMTSTRPYRRSMTPSDVRAEFTRLRGRQFDPKIADMLLTSHRWSELFSETPFRLIQGDAGSRSRVVPTPELSSIAL